MEIQGLIAGLGNPGSQYDQTRHNIGFMTIDALRARLEQVGVGRSPLEMPQDIAGSKHKCELWKVHYNSGIWLFVKPQTFMNLNGESLSSLARFYRIPTQSILVVHDELDLPLGRMRAKTGGGTAGHNGLKSIVERLGTNEFNRLRIGIGKPEKGNVINWVLSRFPVSEQELVKNVISGATDALLAYMKGGIKNIVQQANAFHMESSPDSSRKIQI